MTLQVTPSSPPAPSASPDATPRLGVQALACGARNAHPAGTFLTADTLPSHPTNDLGLAPGYFHEWFLSGNWPDGAWFPPLTVMAAIARRVGSVAEGCGSRGGGSGSGLGGGSGSGLGGGSGGGGGNRTDRRRIAWIGRRCWPTF